MTSLRNFVAMWPVPAAILLCAAMVLMSAGETVSLPEWIAKGLETPETPPEVEPEPAPEQLSVPYAPVPGRDDRTPVAFMSHVFSLNDPNLPTKLSGIGPVYWDHAGRGTGALIAPDVVLTTAHLFVERGKWDGPNGRTEKPPHPSAGRIYLAACGRSYEFKAIHPGSMAPRKRLGLDYAIAELATPACSEASILPVAFTPGDITSHGDQIFLSTGYYRFSEITRYATHLLYDTRDLTNRNERLDLFGVKCQPVAREGTGNVPKGTTAVIATEGCSGKPGSSGGPVLLSRDGGVSYAVVGVRNSSRPGTEYNNDTRIEGAFAAHLSGFVTLESFPETNSTGAEERDWQPGGLWVPSTPSKLGEAVQ